MRGMGSAIASALLGFVILVSATAQAADHYGFDKGHTEIRFKWNHAGLSTQSGEFRDYDGTLVFDREDPANSQLDVVIRVASIDTGVARLDEHLKSAEYFDAETYPEITFESTAVRQTAVDRGTVTGNLTIHGVTRPVTLDVRLIFDGEHPFSAFSENYAGAHYAGFSARTEVLRSDFGMGAAVPLVSDRIEILIDTEMRRQD